MTSLSYRKCVLPLILLCIPSFMGLLKAQAPLDTTSNSNEKNEFVKQSFKPKNLNGFIHFDAPKRTSAISQIDSKDFNKGIINDPALLIQGKIAGVQIYNRGGDPNISSFIRVRGISSFLQKRPLFIIDGVPRASIHSVDPNDIESIKILKDAAAQSMYGMRGASGVVIINTKQGVSITDGFKIQYKGQVGTTTGYPGISVMDAETFRSTGGIDLESSTNWLDEVQRTGLSHTHHLSFAESSKRTHYRISSTYRNIQGVLKKSGFEQFNIRAFLNHKLIENKLDINLNVAFTNRNAKLGFQEAFRYATYYNPTAPVLGQDSPFPFNSEQFGGYFETLGLFDSFNPVAITELNEKDGLRQDFLASALINYKLQEDLSVSARLAYNQSFVNERNYYSPFSNFRGNATTPLIDSRGGGDLFDNTNQFTLFEVFGNYKKTLNQAKFLLTGGLSLQSEKRNEHILALDGYSSNNFLDLRKISAFSNADQGIFTSTERIIEWDHSIYSAYVNAHFNIGHIFFLNTSVRGDYSDNFFNPDNRLGLFPSIGGAIDFRQIIKSSKIESLRLRGNYGRTGNNPENDHFANYSTSSISIINNGTPTVTTNEIEHRNVKWERKTELNLGISFQSKFLSVDIDWYKQNTSDIIASFLFSPTLELINTGSFLTKGLELSVGLNITPNLPKINIKSNFVYSSFNTTIEDYILDKEAHGNLGAPGQNGTEVTLLNVGEEYGNFWGPVFEGVDNIGRPIFQDLNGDGVLIADQTNILNDLADFRVLGNAIPDFEIGWHQQIEVHGWKLDALFRGAFGHSLVNTFRAFYEPRVPSLPSYNRVNTELALPELESSRFSSLYVEKANFYKLDNITLSKKIRIGKEKQNHTLTISLIGQNLFIISNYTGADPEPVFLDYGASANGSLANRTGSLLSPGIDRRNYYLPAKTYLLGIGLEF